LMLSLFLTYGCFFKPEDIMDCLMKQYEILDYRKYRVIRAIIFWLKCNHYHFTSDSMVKKMDTFMTTLQNGNDKELEYRECIVKAWTSTYPLLDTELVGMSPKPKLSEHILKFALEFAEPKNIKNLSVLDFDAIELARQITFMDFQMIRKCNINEFFNVNKWSDTEVCPTLSEFSRWHQKVHNWVCTEIVSIDPYSPSVAKKVIKQFLQIAEHLLLFQNFNSLIAVMGGLEHFGVSRLTKAWKLLKNQKLYKKLRRITNPKRNFVKLRNLYNISNSPYIPPLVLLFRDLVYIQDGNVSFINKNDWVLLNLEKMILFAKIVGKVFNAKKDTPYPFVKVSFIQKYIESYETLSDDELERRSILCE